MNLKYQQELLQQIAAGLNGLGGHQRVALVLVTLKTNDGSFTFDLPAALDALANDIFWDERGNWADARIAIVETI